MPCYFIVTLDLLSWSIKLMQVFFSTGRNKDAWRFTGAVINLRQALDITTFHSFAQASCFRLMHLTVHIITDLHRHEHLPFISDRHRKTRFFQLYRDKWETNLQCLREMEITWHVTLVFCISPVKEPFTRSTWIRCLISILFELDHAFSLIIIWMRPELTMKVFVFPLRLRLALNPPRNHVQALGKRRRRTVAP